MQLIELIRNVEQDGIFIIRDYCKNGTDYNEIYNQIQNMSSEEFLDLELIAKALGYSGVPMVDTLISPRGYRMTSKISRIPVNVIENMVKHFGQLKRIMEASYEELDNVEGIGEARARAIKNGLRRLREQFILNNQL